MISFLAKMNEKSRSGTGFTLRIVVWMYLVLHQDGVNSVQIREAYCTSERFVARCSGSDVILMRSALYGRPRPSRCITSEYSHAMGCYSDVTSYMDDLCSGRQNCSMLVAVVDSIAQPCAKDFKSYLEVVYECIRVSFVDDCRLGNLTRLTGDRGYMAVAPKPKQQQRTPERIAFCAWVISVDAGQKVNITWHHVTSGAVGESTIGNTEGGAGAPGLTEGSKGGGGVFMWPHRCFFSLRFVESGGEEYVHQRCRPHPGEGAIYLSKTNQVQVQVRTNPKELKGAAQNDPIASWRPYVLFYQAFGCSDLLLPEGATIARRGDDIAIICNDSLEIFYITCQYDRWIGDRGNCSRPGQKEGATSGIQQFDADFLSDVGFAVLIGVLLGICSGAVVILLTSQLRSGRRKFPSGRDDFREPYTIDGKADDFDAFVQSIEDATATEEGAPSKLHPLAPHRESSFSCLSNLGGRRTPVLVPGSTAADPAVKDVYTVDGIHGRYINAMPVHCRVDVNSHRALVRPPTIQTVFEMEAFHAKKVPSQLTHLQEEEEEEGEKEAMQAEVASMEAEEAAIDGSNENLRILRT